MNEILNQINDSNLEKFLTTYRQNLILSHSENPATYAWPISEFETVFERIKAAIIKGSFNKDSLAFKKTCKTLGIKHTYAAIENFLKKD
jgi:hypothetical protein